MVDKVDGSKKSAHYKPAAAAEKLKILDALKNALCTKLCPSENDVKRIVGSVGQENKSVGRQGVAMD